MPTKPKALARRWFVGLCNVTLITFVVFAPDALAAQEGSADVRKGKQELPGQSTPYAQQGAGRTVTEVRRIPKPVLASKADKRQDRSRTSAAAREAEAEVAERNDSLPKK
jgi:hypothetical protein